MLSHKDRVSLASVVASYHENGWLSVSEGMCSVYTTFKIKIDNYTFSISDDASDDTIYVNSKHKATDDQLELLDNKLTVWAKDTVKNLEESVKEICEK